jgi:ABC-type sugar transport system substrate-binding protein
MLTGMKKELSFYPDVRFRMKYAKYSSALQKLQIQGMLREGIDLLIVSANESEPVTPVIEEVYNRGIQVVILDRRISSQLFTAYVSGNNVEVDRYAATLLGQRAGERGKYRARHQREGPHSSWSRLMG